MNRTAFSPTLARLPLLLLLAGSGPLAIADEAPDSACDAIPAQTLALGRTPIHAERLLIERRYEAAIEAFSCVVERDPTSVNGYRGRAEARLLLGRFADAFSDYAQITAHVLPVQPDAIDTITYAYQSRLLRNPTDLGALMGESFARWTAYDNEGAAPVFERLAELAPDSVYGTLFGASNRLFLGIDVESALADLDKAIALAPHSADVRYLVADAYTYAYPDLERAFDEATLALDWGLETPRVHAILATCHLAWSDLPNAAHHLARHIDLVTTRVEPATLALTPGSSETIVLSPGVTYEFDVPLTAGESVSIRTDNPSLEIYDSIVVLLSPDGTPVTGNDDYEDFLAGFDWVAPTSGTYRLRVTSFESVGTGELVVARE